MTLQPYRSRISLLLNKPLSINGGCYDLMGYHLYFFFLKTTFYRRWILDEGGAGGGGRYRVETPVITTEATWNTNLLRNPPYKEHFLGDLMSLYNKKSLLKTTLPFLFFRWVWRLVNPLQQNENKNLEWVANSWWYIRAVENMLQY